MSKKNIASEKAPAAIGPYSQAVQAGNLLFISGMLPIREGQLVTDDIAEATKACMENLGHVAKEAGASWGDFVKCTIYLTDLGKFAQVNEAYGTFFAEGNPPARVCVEVCKLPKDAPIEISAIVAVNK